MKYMAEAQDFLELAVPLAAEVVDGIIERAVAARTTVRLKDGYADPVTSADEWAERVLVERILGIRPDDGILGEEGTLVVGTSGVVWVIDPIDGTTNFVYDLPGSAVSIGTEVDGTAIAGVIADLTRGEVFSAALGGGAFRNNVPIQPSDIEFLGRALIGTGIHPDLTRRPDQADALRCVLPRIGDLRRLGSCTVEICSVACGRLDGFFDSGLKPWDLSASLLVAKEAGAQVTMLDGIADGVVVCTAPGIHDEFVELVVAAVSAQ